MRYFNKNIANYSDLGVGLIGGLLNGAAKISWSMIMKPIDTLDTSGPNVNSPFHVKINGLSAGLIASLDANTSAGNPKLRVGARSQSADALQNVNGGTTLSLNTQYTAGGMIDIGGDTITVYLNGAVDAGPTAVTFGAATWTLATASASDVIGGQVTTPPATSTQFGGNIGEFAIWSDDIGAANFAALHRGVSPLLVMPDKLLAYWPLVGRNSPEPELINGVAVTLNGTIAQADHPRVIKPHRARARKFRTAAGAAALTGAAIANAQAAASLTTQIRLAGAAVVVAGASGSLSTAIPLAGAAVSIASGSGGLTAQITLAGAAVAQALAAAGLTTAIPLAGGAAGQASATGALTTGAGGLAGDAVARAAATGALTAQITLTGSAAAIATATGSLNGTPAALAGAATAQASATGAITASIRLTADALAQAAATGSLTVSVRLSGAAAAQALASGNLSIGAVADLDTRFVVSRQTRNWVASRAARNWTVPA